MSSHPSAQSSLVPRGIPLEGFLLHGERRAREYSKSGHHCGHLQPLLQGPTVCTSTEPSRRSSGPSQASPPGGCSHCYTGTCVSLLPSLSAVPFCRPLLPGPGSSRILTSYSCLSLPCGMKESKKEDIQERRK